MISAIPHDSSRKVEACVVGKYSRQKSLTSFIPMRMIAAKKDINKEFNERGMVTTHLLS
jgi:hypothetical protein